MWFELPEGANGVSVEQQEFSVEHRFTDKDGVVHQYFRAPDHFAKQLLDMPGFRSVGSPPDTDLPDLPKADPDRDTAITKLASQVSALKLERDDAIASLKSLQLEFEALQKENEELKKSNKFPPQADKK